MATMTTFTLADKKLYTRVKSTKETIDKRLIDELVARGIKEENITITTEEYSNSGCCPQIKVIANGTPTRVSKTKTVKDDTSVRD